MKQGGETEDEAKFHWSEGMKYAVEGLKLLFILNGAATVSILSFIGNTMTKSSVLVVSMGSFVMGAVMGIIAIWLCYLTQLQYGNAGRDNSNMGGNW